MTYYFFNDMINMKNLDPNKIKMDKKSYKNILIYYSGYVKKKNLSHEKINSRNLLYLLLIKYMGTLKKAAEINIDATSY